MKVGQVTFTIVGQVTLYFPRIPKKLHSDEEFEQWVTVFSEWNTYHCSNGYKPTEEGRSFERMVTASYERGLWYHRKHFNEWKKKHLQPLIDELMEHAAHDPQYEDRKSVV